MSRTEPGRRLARYEIASHQSFQHWLSRPIASLRGAAVSTSRNLDGADDNRYGGDLGLPVALRAWCWRW